MTSHSNGKLSKKMRQKPQSKKWPLQLFRRKGKRSKQPNVEAKSERLSGIAEKLLLLYRFLVAHVRSWWVRKSREHQCWGGGRERYIFISLCFPIVPFYSGGGFGLTASINPVYRLKKQTSIERPNMLSSPLFVILFYPPFTPKWYYSYFSLFLVLTVWLFASRFCWSLWPQADTPHHWFHCYCMLVALKLHCWKTRAAPPSFSAGGEEKKTFTLQYVI